MIVRETLLVDDLWHDGGMRKLLALVLALVAVSLILAGCMGGPLAGGSPAPSSALGAPVPAGGGPATTATTATTATPTTGSPAAPVGDSTRRLVSGGRTRTYLLHVPTAYTAGASVPLVIAFHGYGGTGTAQARMSGMSAVADRNGFIVAYPDGIERAWNDDRGGLTGADPTVDDVAFTRDLIKQLESEYAIDPGRVYATGMSNGGFMCYRLARDLPDLIAAIATVAALLSPNLVRGSSFSTPMPVLIIQGTADPLVPYNGGSVAPSRLNRRGTVMSAPDTARFFARLDGCSPSATTESLPDTAPSDGATATRLTCAGGRLGSEVELITVEGGGHTWPGGARYLPARLIGPVCRDFQAGEVIWEFFARHTRG